MFHKGGDGKPRGFGFGGFNIQRKGTSIETHMAQMGFVGAAGSRGYGPSTNIGKKRVKSEEEYFDDDDEDHNDLEYQPAPGSPSYGKKNSSDIDSDSSDDPLDAFMAGINEQVSKQSIKSEKKGKKDKRGIRDDIEGEDEQESYFRYMEENPTAGLLDDDEADLEYDEDGNVIIPEHKKMIDPLPPIDHTEIEYDRFEKNFYEEHQEIRHLHHNQVNELRDKLGLRVSGILVPKPVTSFGHFGFDDALMKSVRKAGFTQPTPIQAQGVPIAMLGRDVIGIAKTGSGKTAAFVWPLLIHIMDQKELKPGDGPIGLILAPTRELSQQIYHDAKKFGKVYNIKVVCAYGGGSMWEQSKACEEGAEIIVATPGRLIDLVKKKATNLRRVTYVVFDEADRMFDMGFEPQVRSIANHVRPDRQTLLFSATFRKRVERLARDILTDPIRVVQGEVGEANEDVTQVVKVMPLGPAKWSWLLSRLVEFTSVGSVLIFVTRKANSEELAENLRAKDFVVGLLHGDMDQTERNKVITQFKKREVPVLVATDVAARGLDIPSIRVVINYDVARDIDTHTHRVGRTGRAGTKGTAYTMITQKDKEFAGHLVRNLEGASQEVPQELIDLAMQSPWFKKSRYKQGRAKKLNVGGKGLGFRERPGLGASPVASSREGPAATAAASAAAGIPSHQFGGPQSDRISTMKSAFSAQFRTSFVPAEEEEHAVYTNPAVEEANHPQPVLPPLYQGPQPTHSAGGSIYGDFGSSSSGQPQLRMPAGIPPPGIPPFPMPVMSSVPPPSMSQQSPPKPPPSFTHGPPGGSPPEPTPSSSSGPTESKRRKRSRWE